MQIAILPVTELNIDAIGPAVEALRELPLDTINVGLRWFVPANVGAEYERVMREDARRRRRRPGRASTSTGPRSRRREEQQMTGARQAPEGPEAPPLPRLDARHALDLVRSGRAGRARARVLLELRARPSATGLCPVAWYFAQVEPDGEVCFCGDFPGLLHRQRAQAAVPRDLDGGEGRAVPREAREGAAADLRALLRKLRLREVGAAGQPCRERVPRPEP